MSTDRPRFVEPRPPTRSTVAWPKSGPGALAVCLVIALTTLPPAWPWRRTAPDSVLFEQARGFLVAFCFDAWSPAEFVDAMATAKPCRVVVEEGDPSFGTVHIIGQLHESDEDTSAIDREVLARAQAAVLWELLESDARTVFVEGVAAGEPVPAVDASTDSLLRAIAGSMPPVTEFFDRVTEQQVQLLQRSTLVEAAFRALRPGVRLVGADRLASASVGERSVPSKAREAAAMGTILDHFARHPGDTVHLVYGAMHIFDADDLPAGARVPRIIRTSFGWLFAQDPQSQALLADVLRVDPASLRRFVGLLEGVHPSVFPLLDAESQRECLQKPFYLDHKEFRTPVELGRWLRRHARTREIRRTVEAGVDYFEP